MRQGWNVVSWGYNSSKIGKLSDNKRGAVGDTRGQVTLASTSPSNHSHYDRNGTFSLIY